MCRKRARQREKAWKGKGRGTGDIIQEGEGAQGGGGEKEMHIYINEVVGGGRMAGFWFGMFVCPGVGVCGGFACHGSVPAWKGVGRWAGSRWGHWDLGVGNRWGGVAGGLEQVAWGNGTAQVVMRSHHTQWEQHG